METRGKLGIVAAVCVLVACLAGSAAAKTIYVAEGATEGGNGSSWATAYTYLQDALTMAGPGDEIRVAEGVYCPDRAVVPPPPAPASARTGHQPVSPGMRSPAFRLKINVTVKGGFAGFRAQDPNERDTQKYETILSGDLQGSDEDKTGLWSPLIAEFVLSDNSSYVVIATKTDTPAVLDGCTITGATMAGLFNDQGNPTITNCTFRRNSTDTDGGALRSTGGHPSLSRCVFQENSALSRGGAIRADAGALTLMDCRFLGNAAYGEGGAVSSSCALDVTDCVFEQNVANTGGAVLQRQDVLDLAGCRFAGNLAYRGGALCYADSRRGRAMKCEFQANWAQSTGGAVHVGGADYSTQGPITFENCTFTGNSAGLGGVLCVNGISRPSQKGPALINCLFTGNRADGSGGVILADSSRLTITNCTFADNSAIQWPTLNWIGYRWTPGDQPAITITNCILWDRNGVILQPLVRVNKQMVAAPGNLIVITYSDVRGAWYGQGNIDVDPCFAGPGACVDASNPTIGVKPDHPNATWVLGDYHLRSQAGRWDPARQEWVQDGVTSPCIDAGDPESAFANEPEPNGGRVNMGAYGGTAEASKSFIRNP